MGESASTTRGWSDGPQTIAGLVRFLLVFAGLAALAPGFERTWGGGRGRRVVPGVLLGPWGADAGRERAESAASAAAVTQLDW